MRTQRTKLYKLSNNLTNPNFVILGKRD